MHEVKTRVTVEVKVTDRVGCNPPSPAFVHRFMDLSLHKCTYGRSSQCAVKYFDSLKTHSNEIGVFTMFL